MIFTTSNHRCSIGDLNVQISDLEEEEEGRGPALQFSHAEALEFAHALLAREAELQARQAALEAQFSQLSLALIDLFTTEAEEKSTTIEEWQREIVHLPGFSHDFDLLLNRAYKRLKQQKALQVSHWYHENEKQEAGFWLAFERYFYEYHRDDLIEKYAPEA